MIDISLEIAGEYHGWFSGSGGVAWAQLTSASFYNQQSAADPAVVLPGSLVFSGYIVRNTHATQTLYIADAAVGVAAAVPGNRMALGPGESRTIVCAGLGGNVSTISIAGSGAGTTCWIDAYFMIRI